MGEIELGIAFREATGSLARLRTEASLVDSQLLSTQISKDLRNALCRQRAASLVLMCAVMERYVDGVFNAVSGDVQAVSVSMVRESWLAFCLGPQFDPLSTLRAKSKVFRCRRDLLEAVSATRFCPPIVSPFSGGKTIGKDEVYLICDVLGIQRLGPPDWAAVVQARFDSLSIKRNELAHGTSDSLVVGNSISFYDLCRYIDCVDETILALQCSVEVYLRRKGYLR